MTTLAQREGKNIDEDLHTQDIEALSSPEQEVGTGSFIPSKIDEYKARSTLEMNNFPWNMVAADVPLPSVLIQDVSSEPDNLSNCIFPTQSNHNPYQNNS